MTIADTMRAEIVRLAQKLPRCPYQAETQAAAITAISQAISALAAEARVDAEIDNHIKGPLAFAGITRYGEVEQYLQHFRGPKR